MIYLDINELIDQLIDYSTDDDSANVGSTDSGNTGGDTSGGAGDSVAICDVHVFAATDNESNYTPLSSDDIEGMWNQSSVGSKDIWIRKDDGSKHSLCPTDDT